MARSGPLLRFLLSLYLLFEVGANESPSGPVAIVYDSESLESYSSGVYAAILSAIDSDIGVTSREQRAELQGVFTKVADAAEAKRRNAQVVIYVTVEYSPRPQRNFARVTREYQSEGLDVVLLVLLANKGLHRLNPNHLGVTCPVVQYRLGGMVSDPAWQRGIIQDSMFEQSTQALKHVLVSTAVRDTLLMEVLAILHKRAGGDSSSSGRPFTRPMAVGLTSAAAMCVSGMVVWGVRGVRRPGAAILRSLALREGGGKAVSTTASSLPLMAAHIKKLKGVWSGLLHLSREVLGRLSLTTEPPSNECLR